MSATSGDFPAPPTTDPAAALHDPNVAELQRLHNYLAVNFPADLAAATPGETAVDTAIYLLGSLPN